ncbi:MAG: hypothetical protein CBC48_16240 [bacterium TMED88]|nr:hypothetical protein [Deltaproteobacteria bacterium]OUV25512.1 MAG: hypothetical protein CBC48_16240 [bacterium TMED88]
MSEKGASFPGRPDWADSLSRVLSPGHGFQADVLLFEGDAGIFVVKDFRGQGGWLRRWAGRWLCAREVRAYRRLEGVSAVPRLLERLDDFAFALEYRPGTWLSRALKGKVSKSFVKELERNVAAMHAKGVVHLDLRHRSNVLAGEDGRPVIIDFASALCLRPGSWFCRGIARFDRRAVEKWRARIDPD